MSSVFTRIINGEIPCYKIAENESCFAFLDISPLAKGHTLVVPKKEVDYIFDINGAEYAELWSFARKVSAAIEKVVSCKRIGIAVIGLEVPHAHIHLIPMNRVSDMNFANPKLKFPDAEMLAIAKQISDVFSS